MKNAPSKAVYLIDTPNTRLIGLELKAMSDWLDANMDLLDWVGADIKQRNVEQTGRKGLSVESVLRCALLKQYRQLSYEELVFCLMDSTSCQTFARLPPLWSPKKATLQSCISAISDVTWEQINQRLLQCAEKAKAERGDMLRMDSTVTESPIHAPSDSTLLWDSVRVLVRLLKAAEALSEGHTRIDYRNHERVAKKRARAICYTRGQDKKHALYRDLVEVTQVIDGIRGTAEHRPRSSPLDSIGTEGGPTHCSSSWRQCISKLCSRPVNKSGVGSGNPLDRLNPLDTVFGCSSGFGPRLFTPVSPFS